MKNSTFTITLITVAILSGTAGFTLRWWQTQPETKQTETEKTTIGSQPQNINLPDLNGTLQSSEQWQGKPTLINFWASWCAPCREELPVLKQLHRKYKDTDLKIIGIALDEPQAAKKMAEEFNIKYPTLTAEPATGMVLMESYANNTGAMPYTVIISKEGKIAAQHWGVITMKQAEQMIKPLL